MTRRNKAQDGSAMTEAKRRAALLIASGSTGAAAAEQLGITEGTISRWRQTPDFQAALNEIHQQAREAAIARLRTLTSKALAAVEQVLTSADSSNSDRLRAAAMVLDRVGLTELPPIGPTEADSIRQDAIAKQQWDAALDGLNLWAQ